MKAVVITGPTASGKTSLSLDLAGDLFEILSADSVQVYRGLDIGSGKPSIEERSRVKHYLIDEVEPDFLFTAGEYCRRAVAACEEIKLNEKVPMFVGGTGLYIDSFFKGISEIPPVVPEIREALYSELEKEGSASLYSELLKADPEFAVKIHINDRQRILRGLEVLRSTGYPISSFFSPKPGAESEDTLYAGLYIERDILIKRIKQRISQMIGSGFIEEVQSLREAGYHLGHKSMRSIGYLELNRFLEGKSGLDEAVSLIERNTVKYSKRQMTWFRKNKRIVWFDAFDKAAVRDYVCSRLF